MTFFTIYCNLIGIVGGTGEQCWMDNRDEGEREGDGGNSFFILCIDLTIFNNL